MLVSYVGHIPSFIYEFNGKRYMFTNKGTPTDIPPEALRHLYSSRTPNALDIIPLENKDVEKIKEENSMLKKEIAELTELVKDLERKVKKDGRKK